MNWISDLGAGLADAGKSVGDWTTEATDAVGMMKCNTVSSIEVVYTVQAEQGD